ncbi:MAG: sensor histidine kinase [Erythrobacter sp.]
MIAPSESFAAARGITDERDRLISADTPLALLQERCGGALPGMLAIPELLEQVQHARAIGLRIARSFSAFDGEDVISGFVRINPRGADAGGGCEVLVESWQRSPAAFSGSHALAQYLDAIDRASAEITLRLDARQRVQMAGVLSADAQGLGEAMAARPDALWSDLIELPDVAHRRPLHWRLLDGAMCRVPGSDRTWRARLMPVAEYGAGREPSGFELLLIADEPLAADTPPPDDARAQSRMFGRMLAPALRQPLARITANAETIRARLAGPLHQDYCHYAATIASAAQHLSGMLDDLADLEVVEAPGFATLAEDVDLVDAARKAVGILGVRAHDRRITLTVAGEAGAVLATAEFRRVLQILINLVGNAIAYSPEGSTVEIRPEHAGQGRVRVMVRDQGPGISAEQAAHIFEKFERLGRDSAGGTDKGSGLGLYIARLLARAMRGELSVTSAPGEGAVFTLELPQAD